MCFCTGNGFSLRKILVVDKSRNHVQKVTTIYVSTAQTIYKVIVLVIFFKNPVISLFTSQHLTYSFSLQEKVQVRVARIFNTFGTRMHMNDGKKNYVLCYLLRLAQYFLVQPCQTNLSFCCTFRPLINKPANKPFEKLLQTITFQVAW